MVSLVTLEPLERKPSLRLAQVLSTEYYDDIGLITKRRLRVKLPELSTLDKNAKTAEFHMSEIKYQGLEAASFTSQQI